MSGERSIDVRLGVPLVLLAAVLPFVNGLSGGFVWDDTATVLTNTRAHGFAHLPQLFGWGEATFRYRIGRDLSQMLDYQLGGLNPFVYHLFNLIYHALTTWLVFVIARGITGNRAAALWGAALFAVHPVHVDSVTYISGRRDVLSTLFYLASVAAYLRFRDTRSTRWFGWAVLWAVCGVMTKEMAATVAGAWFLVDLARCARGEQLGTVAAARRVLTTHWRLYGSGALAAALFILYMLLFQNTGGGHPPHGGSWPANFMTVAVVMAHGLRLLFLPTGLLLDYEGVFAPVTSPLDPRLAVALAVLGAAAWAGSWMVRRGGGAAMFGVHWLWMTYVPVMHIIPHYELFAEHYLYLPSVGFCMLAGIGLARLPSLHPGLRRAAPAAGVAVLLVLAVGTWDRNRDFANAVTVLEAQLERVPGSSRVNNNLAMAYRGQGRNEEALDMYRRYLEQVPDDVSARNTAAATARAAGDVAASRDLYLESTRRAPDNLAAWMGLGIALQSLNDAAEAEAAFRRGAELAPKAYDPWNNLGVLYALSHRPEQARDAFARAVASVDAPPAAGLNLARAELALGHCDAAKAALAAIPREAVTPQLAGAITALIRKGQARCGNG
ncbi:MAG: tetratricopeptide repeat protein [Nitrospirota bacterium]|nr:tetratricopeptide repeat protein [Nitrospirota bacterium]